MVCKPGVMAQIIRDGMDAYWRAVYSPTDEGLDATEIEWKRDHQQTIKRMEEKFGDAYAEFFEKNR